MNFNFKKQFGQHFLINENIINTIINSASKFDELFEIGPGAGALTKPLIAQNKKITAIDIDIDCIENLKKIKGLNLIHEDILEYEIPYLPIIGNLPYNIGTKIIEKIVYKPIPYGIFMLQKEVANRLTGKEYSKLTVFAQARYNISKLINVPSSAFIPQPEVESQVIILEKHEKYKNIDLEKLKKLTFLMFNFRRKKITFLKKQNENIFKIIKQLNINENLRPEDLSKEQYYSICELI